MYSHDAAKVHQLTVCNQLVQLAPYEIHFSNIHCKDTPVAAIDAQLQVM